MAKKKEVQQQISEQQQKLDFSQLVKTLKKTTDHQLVKIGNQLPEPPFWLSTGDDILDIYISNKKHGGIAGGRITSFNGLPACVTEDTKIKIKIK